MAVPQRKGEPVRLTGDEGPREDTSLEALAKLKPAFASNGSVTAGNSSPLNDGATALVLMSESKARERNLQPLARIASLADYAVRIIDPRTAFATEERFPGAALSHEWPDEALAAAPLSPRSAIVALTHDPKLDDPALIAALRSSAFYIGALGSRTTHARRLERLKAQGFGDTELARIHGPIGLDIGARSPAEIAVAILGEMTAQLRKG